jgi:thiol-disulfide isomerase/thioredoxin
VKAPIRFIAAALAITQVVIAGAQTNHRLADLMVGDNAPAISVGKWVKGKAVDGFEKGKVYVVEFWATWCGPCKQSIPHLTELQKKFGDKATFIGVSAFENNWAGVEPFVQSEGDKMDYNVAMDHVAAPTDREGDMAKNWMEAAHQPGIPTAFVIDREGKIAWIGHPMELESPLTQIVGGTWDRDKAATKFEATLAASAEMDAFYKAYATAMRAKNWPDALKAIDLHAAKLGDRADTYRLQVCAAEGDEQGFGTLATKLMQSHPDDIGLLNQIAWAIADPKSSFKHRDLKLAKKAAEKAVELTGHKEPGILDTLAWVYHWSGDKAKAISTETDAIAKTTDDAEKANLNKTLDTFKSG